MTDTLYSVGARPAGTHDPAQRLGLLRTGALAWWKHRSRYAGGLRGAFTTAQVKAAHAWASARGYELIVTPLDVHPHLVGDTDCHTDLLDALEHVGRTLGKVIRIRSGRRTMAEQWALYNANMESPGHPKPGHPLTAYPDANAPHVRGIAADCGIDGVNIGEYPGAIEAMKAAGVCLPVASESWHCSLGADFAWRP